MWGGWSYLTARPSPTKRMGENGRPEVVVSEKRGARAARPASLSGEWNASGADQPPGILPKILNRRKRREFHPVLSPCLLVSGATKKGSCNPSIWSPLFAPVQKSSSPKLVAGPASYSGAPESAASDVGRGVPWRSADLLSAESLGPVVQACRQHVGAPHVKSVEVTQKDYEALRILPFRIQYFKLSAWILAVSFGLDLSGSLPLTARAPRWKTTSASLPMILPPFRS